MKFRMTNNCVRASTLVFLSTFEFRHSTLLKRFLFPEDQNQLGLKNGQKQIPRWAATTPAVPRAQTHARLSRAAAPYRFPQPSQSGLPDYRRYEWPDAGRRRHEGQGSAVRRQVRRKQGCGSKGRQATGG